ISLTLEECATGVTKEIAVDTAVLCDVCRGSGSQSGSKTVTCDTCDGRGEIQTVQRSFLGQVMTSRPRPVCQGYGEIISAHCTKYGGDGRVRARRTVTVNIPRGVGDGLRIRLAGQGEVCPGGGPAGALYVVIAEAPPEVFLRQGSALHCHV